MPEAVPAATRATPGSGRARLRRAREIPFRDIGRKVVLFAAANSVVSLFLPWVRTTRESLNAFGLSSASLRALGIERACWISKAVWFVPLGAAIAAVVALVDRRRSTGMLLPYVSFAAGGWMVLLAGNVFETYPLLRQLGVVACGFGGIVFAGGGAILLRAGWRPAPAKGRSVGSTLRRLPWASVALVLTCAVVHALLSFDGARARAWSLEFGLIAGSLKLHALVTYVFLHGDWLHLGANAAVLLAVGGAIERRVGRATFVAVFIVAGVAGGIASAALDPRIHAALVGSSGAVAGCVGLCLVVAPRAKVGVWVYMGLAVTKVRVQAAWFFSAWMLFQAVGSVYLSMGESDSTAYWAHLGGMAAGIALGATLLRLGALSPDEDAPSVLLSREGAKTNRGLRRATKRERTGLRHMPRALVSVAILVSAIAAALTFHPASLERNIASFQRAWNSGDLDRVADFFRHEKRPEFRTRLERLVRRFDHGAAEGRTSWRIALSGAVRTDVETTVMFFLSPPGEDPFRARRSNPNGSRLSVLFRRECGTWRARAVAASAEVNASPTPPLPLPLRPDSP